MRFSMKWALAAIAYVALAAAAIGSRSYLMADLVWAVTALTFCYVAAVFRFASGRRQAAAFGFVILLGLYVVGLYLHPNSLSSKRAFKAAGYSLSSAGRVYEIVNVAGGGTEAKQVDDLFPGIRAANAVTAMTAGLIGALLGSLAFRQAANCDPADAG